MGNKILNEDELITVQQISDKYVFQKQGILENTAERTYARIMYFIKQYKIKHNKVGRIILISVSEINEFLYKRRKPILINK